MRQLVHELGLTDEAAGTRCDRCNVEVQRVDAEAVRDVVPPYVAQTQRDFRRCPSCGRVYWPATHWNRIHAILECIRKPD